MGDRDGTVTKTVTEETATDEETKKLLKKW